MISSGRCPAERNFHRLKYWFLARLVTVDPRRLCAWVHGKKKHKQINQHQSPTNYKPSKSNRMVVYLFKMAIFYSYVKSPEGKSNRNTNNPWPLCFHTVNVGASGGHIPCLAATQYWVELWKIPWTDQLSQLITVDSSDLEELCICLISFWSRFIFIFFHPRTLGRSVAERGLFYKSFKVQASHGSASGSDQLPSPATAQCHTEPKSNSKRENRFSLPIDSLWVSHHVSSWNGYSSRASY